MILANSPLLVFAIPLVGMATAFAMAVAGWRKLHAGAVLTLAVSIGAFFLAEGVSASCRIDESECLGTTATAYVVGAIWLAAAHISVLMISRLRAAIQLGSESEK